MQTKTFPTLLMVVVLASLGQAFAQQDAQPSTKPISVYRVEFVFNELQDGKQINSRRYEMLAKADETNRLRIGSRVPVSTTGGGFQYLDVGMNMDCRVAESEGKILLNITADSSGFALPQGKSVEAVSGQPVILQMRFGVDTVVLPGKPTLVSSMDDPSSNSRFQLEVTATKVK